MSASLIFAIPALLAGCYYLLALYAAVKTSSRLRRAAAGGPRAVSQGVSILKPVHGWDDRLAQAVLSHARQDYGEYELLLGVRDSDTRALEEIRKLQRSFANVRIVPVVTEMPNGKVGSLYDMAAAARYPILVINDADIIVEKDYLQRVAGPLQNPQIGLVTALYRAVATSAPAHFEALGVAAEFVPSVLVARLMGVAEFALGSTMALRAADLERIGGFAPIGEYLADDYQLGLRITRLGLHVAFASAVVETTLGGGDWDEVWRHQVRWSRTVRVSRGAGYFGYVVTQATIWAVVAAAAGYWDIAAGVLAIRLAAGMSAAGGVLKDWESTRRWWMIPARDVFGFGVWAAALFGNTVEWRGTRLQLTGDGRIKAAGRS